MGLRRSYKDRGNHTGKWASHTDIGCHLRKVVVCELTKKVLGDLCKKCLCVGEKICRKMVAWFQV